MFERSRILLQRGSMSTQTVIEKIQRHGKEARRRVLTEEERESARKHAEQRDFGVSTQTPKNRTKIRNSESHRSYIIIPFITVLIILCSATITGAFWYIHNRELLRSTAERELIDHASQLNFSLPSENQLDISSINVQYSNINQLVVSFVQGNTHCTLPVNSPDSKHNLYWVTNFDAVSINQIDNINYKCVESVSFVGLGNTTQ